MWLCVNVTAGRVGRMYGNYANVQENFRVFLPLKVAQCLKGAWKLFVRSLPENPVPEHCCGSLMAPVQSVAFSGPCRSATATARARGCKIPKVQETQSAFQHRGLPVGNKAAPCFSAPSCPGLSLYAFPSLSWSLAHWHNAHFSFLGGSCYISSSVQDVCMKPGDPRADFALFLSMQENTWGNKCLKQVWCTTRSRSPTTAFEGSGFCFAEGAPCLASLVCYCQVITLPCISTTFYSICGLNSQQWKTAHLN